MGQVFSGLLFFLLLPHKVWGGCPKDLKEWQELEKAVSKSYSLEASDPERQLLEDVPLSKLLESNPNYDTDRQDIADLKSMFQSEDVNSYLKKCYQKTPDTFLQMNLMEWSKGSTYTGSNRPDLLAQSDECIEKLKSKKQTDALKFNDLLRRVIAKNTKPFIDPMIDHCLRNVKDPALELCLSDFKVNRLKKRIDADDHGSRMPVSEADYRKNNSSAIGIETIPTEINNPEVLKGLSNPKTVDATIQKLKASMESSGKTKDPILFINNTIHPGLPMDKKKKRLVVNFNDGNCNRTYIISLPDQSDLYDDLPSNKQFSVFALCNHDPKTGKPVDPPIQFIDDYWREYRSNSKSGLVVEIKNRTSYPTGGESCTSCHTKGPIQFNSDRKLSTSQDLDGQEKLNARYASFKKADFVTFDPVVNQYVKTFDRDYQKLLGTPIGPIRSFEDPYRNAVLDQCLPETPEGYLDSEKFKKGDSKKKLRNLIGNAMNCSSCHNEHQEGAIFQFRERGLDRRPVQLKDYFLSDNPPHEMPPNLTQDGISKADQPKIRKMLYACLLFEKNGEWPDRVDLSYLTEDQINRKPPKDQLTQKGESCPDGSKYKPSLTENTSGEASKATNCPPGSLVPEPLSGVMPALAQANGIKTTKIADHVRKGDGVENTDLHCKDGKLYFPVFAVPGCDSGSCNPFSTTMQFDQNGNFEGFSKEFCSNCADYPLQKYGHVNANATELSALESYLKTTTTQVSNDSPYLPKGYFVDGLSGATQVSYPVKGMGESTYILNQYAKDVSGQIRQNKGGLCP